MGGLATAALLARGGARVTLLERHDTVGGRAGELEVDGFRFDTGPSWYLMPEVFEHFFALLGERVEDHLDLVGLDPAYRVFFEPDGDGPSPTFDVAADPEATWAAADALAPGAGQALRRYAADAGEAYRLALARFLHTTFERPDRVADAAVLRRLPRLARLLTTSLDAHAAAAVPDPRLRQVLGYPAVFLGSSPRRAPALYSLMSHLDLVDGVRYPRGGMRTVVTALEKAALAQGAELRTGAHVVGIEVEDAPPRARGLHGALRAAVARRATGRTTGVRLASGEVVPADVVVSAADRHHTETVLLPPGHQDLPEEWWSTRGPGISALLVMAGVRGELPGLPHHSLFFTRDWDANFDAVLGRDRASTVDATGGTDGLRPPVPGSLYVSRTSATDTADGSRPAAPPGHENLFVLVPLPADASLGADDASRARAEALADAYLDQVGRWAGVPDLRSRVVVRRVVTPADLAADLHSWRGSALGMEHTLRQSAMFRPAGRSRHVPNLYHVGGGSAPGVGLPMCLISAQLVVKRLLGETSSRPLPAPLRPGFLAASRRPDRLAGEGA